jgi:hypothetical protein
MCFGTCPAYEVTLRRDGTAGWRGEAWVERMGLFGGTFDPDEFELLTRFIERSSFFDWSDEYRPAYQISDGPGYDLEVTRGHLTKRVHQYGSDEPADFWVIAALVDGLATKVAWVPIGV